MSLAFDFRDRVLDAALSGEFYASLHTSDPKDSGAHELDGKKNGYSRQSTSFLLSVGGSKTNSEKLVWTSLPRATVKYVGLWTDCDGGEFLLSFALADEKNIGAGDTLSIESGKLSLSVE